MKYQIHLNAKNCSGRGVRFQPLDPARCESLILTAAKEVGSEGSMAELSVKAVSNGIKAMIVAVTKEDNLKDLGGATWMPMDAEKLETEYAKFFNAKDDKILTGIYREHHEISKEELDAISGKASPLAD